MFRDTIKKLVDRLEGGVGGVLMGFDGITVESYVRDGAHGIHAWSRLDPLDQRTQECLLPPGCSIFPIRQRHLRRQQMVRLEAGREIHPR